MNALVLGGNGFIGSHLVDRLIAEGHNVRVYDKYEEYFRRPLPGVDYQFGEFGNRGLLADALQEMEIVFHLISTSNPSTSNVDPAFDVQSNVVDSLFLLEKCVEIGTRKIVYVSSGGTVYGSPSILPVLETHPTEPMCSYGISKLTTEKYLALYRLLKRLDYVVIRPSNAYGPRQNPTSIQGAIPVFLSRIARNETIEVWGDGSVIRDYVYVNDLVDGIYRATVQTAPSRIYNFGCGVGLSLHDIVASVRRVVDRDISVLFSEKRVFDVPSIYLDVSRAWNELGWKPMTPIDDGIRQTWQFILSQKEQPDSRYPAEK
ncbi:MAG TPA: NAD-dependent epimerase/dehydratase family protein [Desulfuromonadales bacterium]|nr:NAD-dependent epimerase/dehydratase family protein [Desulfuromonadales bacterium]